MSNAFDNCEPIRRLREHRTQTETRIKQYAAQVYDTFDENERLIVRFGMFPANKMKQADEHMIAELALCDDPMDKRDIGRLLAVGIMDAANAGKDKMVV